MARPSTHALVLTAIIAFSVLQLGASLVGVDLEHVEYRNLRSISSDPAYVDSLPNVADRERPSRVRMHAGNVDPFAIAIAITRRVVEDDIGYWTFNIWNGNETEATIRITASNDLGTAVTESSERCASALSGWDCTISARDELNVTFAASVEHNCDASRIRLTIVPSVEGHTILHGQLSGLVNRGSTFDCPDIMLSNPAFDPAFGIATWDVEISMQNWANDPGIDITLGSHVEVGALPDGCTSSGGTVTCKVTEFNSDPSDFNVRREIGQSCTPQSIDITASAKFADDGVPITVQGTSLSIPELNPCISTIEIIPQDLTLSTGSSAEIGANVFDDANESLVQLPPTANLTWGAARGSVSSLDGLAANYRAPETQGDGTDTISASLTYGGLRLNASAQVVITQPQPTASPPQTPSPTNTPTPIPPTTTVSHTPSPTNTSTPIPPSATPTHAPSPTYTPTPIPTTATTTHTPAPTHTPTPVPPTSTPDHTTTPTQTPSPTNTPTPFPPTATPISPPTPVPPSVTQTTTPSPTQIPTVQPCQPPRQPRAISAELASASSMRIAWEPPNPRPTDCPLLGYRLRYARSSSDEPYRSISVASESTSIIVDDIQAGILYEYALWAFSSAGDGDFASGALLMPLPTPTPTPSQTPPQSSISPTATSTPTSTPSSSRRQRKIRSPERPEEVDAERGSEAMVVYWERPKWDGGAQIVAYSLDWTPNPLPFQTFIPARELSIPVYGLDTDVRYRMKVRAHNSKRDGISGFVRVELGNTLMRRRGTETYAGSISYGMSTTLSNDDDMEGFAILASEESMFYGDRMIVNIGQVAGRELDAKAVPADIEFAAKAYSISFEVASNRDLPELIDSEYRLMQPLEICIAPLEHATTHRSTYAIALTSSGNDVRILDSTPTLVRSRSMICAPIWDIPTQSKLTVALVRHVSLESTPDGSESTHRSAIAASVATIPVVLLILVLASSLTARHRSQG